MVDPAAALGPPGTLAVFLGALVLGLVHGAEPGHGWPIAATYALGRPHAWLHGLAASVLLGLGHLVSSLAVVGAFFLAKSALDLAGVNRPAVVFGLSIGGPVEIVAGVLLIGLGVREYRHGHVHGQHHDRSHGSAGDADRALFRDHEADLVPLPESNGHDGARDDDRGWGRRLASALPLVGGHSHDHPSREDLDTEGLLGIVWTAFVLGFVHEEEFEIIGLCAGSRYCLELMLTYAVAVLVALVGLTMLLIAGYARYEARVERYTDYLPTVSAAVLVTMGVGFVLGVF